MDNFKKGLLILLIAVAAFFFFRSCSTSSVACGKEEKDLLRQTCENKLNSAPKS
ncbi:hypothetical protein ABK658_16070 [Enterobacter roggenkampii]|uniref:hypothetical protein n=1 Tax=Enterobacteriaceae TaxID=543 RepID=UPI0012B72FF2|nr:MULTISPECIES: hypothetical protein [Enterobacteriaceae]MCM7432398.1 hypothetical protein [Enterobacter hormaechei]MCD5283162.1 hypothetical protein [Enterobacter roggenkampii]MCD5288232.1 hypothetical protein [Enterobacter roggenkampii]MCD5292775.1 hypothetical protein [Enterobacter roggenkampii]MCD5297795.1 hypothetical protein [Enterobacter roggenkampii]